MADFSALQAKAQTLVAANGGSVTFRQYDTTPAAPSQPWEGPTDPRAGGVVELEQTAVWAQPSSAITLGFGYQADDLLKRSDQMLIIAGNDTDDLTDFDEVDGPGGIYKIDNIQKLMPDGETVLVWFVGVSK